MSTDSFDANVIFLVHHNEPKSAEISITFEGESYRLRGMKENMLDLSMSIVTLCTVDSTTHAPVLADSAAPDFLKALERLLERRQKFATLLRPNWLLPAYVWDLM